MELADHVIGVCSWSLKARDNDELIHTVKSLKLAHIQLALNPLLEKDVPFIDGFMRQLEKEQIALTAGMVGFPGEDYTSIATIRQTGGFMLSEKWDERRKIAESAARTAHRLRISMVSTHIGFVPSSSDPSYSTIVQRMRDIADIFKTQGLMLLMETGQEPASELLQFLNDVARPNVGVNFDPANMILYGAGNPVDAIRTLGRHVHHVHIKDAIASSQPGTIWGEEVAFGKGQVNAMAFLDSLRFGGYRGPLVIEREGGAHRAADVHHAIGVLESILAPHPSEDGE